MATEGKGKDREQSPSAGAVAAAAAAQALSNQRDGDGVEDVACKCLNVRLSARAVQGDGSSSSSSASSSSEHADSIRIQVTQDSFRVSLPDLVTLTRQQQGQQQRKESPVRSGSRSGSRSSERVPSGGGGRRQGSLSPSAVRKDGAASPSASQTTTAAASASSAQPTTTTLRCLLCSTDVLTYSQAITEPAASQGAGEPGVRHLPASEDGTYIVHRHTLIRGTAAIHALTHGENIRPNDKRIYSSLFDVLVESGNDKAAIESHGKDKSTTGSSDMDEDSRTESTSGGDEARRPATALPPSPFRVAAEGQIKREKAELETRIQQLRDGFAMRSRTYFAHAEGLSACLLKAKAATDTAAPKPGRARSMSPSTSTSGVTAVKAKDYQKAVGHISSPPVVIRGGFDDVDQSASSPGSGISKAASPSRSTTIAPTFVSGTSKSSIPNELPPHFLSTVLGASAASAAASQAGFAGPSGPRSYSYQGYLGTKAGSSAIAGRDSPTGKDVARFAKAAEPLSPSFRRSRSPSPSRDAAGSVSARARSTSREQDRGRRDAPAAALSMDSGAPLSTSASGSDRAESLGRRPALDLEKDVASQATHLVSSAASEGQLGAGGAVPSHSSHKPIPASSQSEAISTSTAPAVSAAHTARNARRAGGGGGGAWLRLNAVSPSPPASRSFLQNLEAAVEENEKAHADKRQKEEAGGVSLPNVSAGASGSAERPSLSGTKARHVSFKEPEKVSRGEDSPSEGLAEPEYELAEAEETAFELDEEIEDTSDDEDISSEETVDTSVASATAAELNRRDAITSQQSHSRSLSPTQQGGLNSNVNGSGSARQQNLLELLDEARSFVDTIKKVNMAKRSELASSLSEAYASGIGGRRYYGSTRLTGDGLANGNASMRQASAQATPEMAASLREQARKFRDSTAMDLPSHRSSRRRAKAAKGGDTSGRRGREAGNRIDFDDDEQDEDDITDEQLDQLAPVYSMATSLPISIGFPMAAAAASGRKQHQGAHRPRDRLLESQEASDVIFEQKTSVPNRENMMVPRLGLRRDASQRGEGAPSRKASGGLSVLGEESEPPTPAGSTTVTPTQSRPASASTSLSRLDAREGIAVPGAAEALGEEREEAATRDVSQNSPPVPALNSVSAAMDATVANVNRVQEGGDESLEARDQVGSLATERKGFVPPHVWSRRKVDELGMLGTSVHDYD